MAPVAETQQPGPSALVVPPEEIASRIAKLDPRWCDVLLQLLDQAEASSPKAQHPPLQPPPQQQQQQPQPQQPQQLQQQSQQQSDAHAGPRDARCQTCWSFVRCSSACFLQQHRQQQQQHQQQQPFLPPLPPPQQPLPTPFPACPPPDVVHSALSSPQVRDVPCALSLPLPPAAQPLAPATDLQPPPPPSAPQGPTPLPPPSLEGQVVEPPPPARHGDGHLLSDAWPQYVAIRSYDASEFVSDGSSKEVGYLPFQLGDLLSVNVASAEKGHRMNHYAVYAYGQPVLGDTAPG